MKATTRSAVFLLCASLSALATDLTLTMTGTGKGHAGEQTQYWSAKFMRINNGGNQMDTMVDFEQGVSYNIDHKKKLIQRIGWDDLEASMKAMSEKMEAMSEKMKDLPPSVQKMMGGGDTTVTVEEQGSETILGRKCRRWKVTMGSTILESSHDPSLKPPVPLTSYKRFLRLQQTMGQMGPRAAGMLKVGEEMAKIQGVALKTHTVLPMVGEVTSVATAIKEGPIPASTFTLPEGYKVEDTGKKMRESLAKGR